MSKHSLDTLAPTPMPYEHYEPQHAAAEMEQQYSVNEVVGQVDDVFNQSSQIKDYAERENATVDVVLSVLTDPRVQEARSRIKISGEAGNPSYSDIVTGESLDYTKTRAFLKQTDPTSYLMDKDARDDIQNVPDNYITKDKNTMQAGGHYVALKATEMRKATGAGWDVISKRALEDAKTSAKLDKLVREHILVMGDSSEYTPEDVSKVSRNMRERMGSLVIGAFDYVADPREKAPDGPEQTRKGRVAAVVGSVAAAAMTVGMARFGLFPSGGGGGSEMARHLAEAAEQQARAAGK